VRYTTGTAQVRVRRLSLTGLAREAGTTVVLVTRVAAYADRVVMVRDGLVSSPGHPVGHLDLDRVGA
jgi:predicted ABC-type transport system involved in lysophospholipase L1 biosynthesis ATPase subunit